MPNPKVLWGSVVWVEQTWQSLYFLSECYYILFQYLWRIISNWSEVQLIFLFCLLFLWSFLFIILCPFQSPWYHEENAEKWCPGLLSTAVTLFCNVSWQCSYIPPCARDDQENSENVTYKQKYWKEKVGSQPFTCYFNQHLRWVISIWLGRSAYPSA